MKKFFLILIVILGVGLFYSSCGKKKGADSDSTKAFIEEENVSKIQDATFNNNWNVAYDMRKNLSREKFDSLKLNTLSFLPPYENLDFQIGRVLLNTEDKKLLSVKAIASGEISEYLLGYINGNITDSLLVAYEDNVEYYSATSSIVDNNKITVTTINRDYSGASEISDTISTIYEISSKLTFDEVIEQ